MDNVTHSNEKISEALKLLNEAAREKKMEFQHLLTDKYAHLKDAVVESEEKLVQTLAKAKEYGVEKVKLVDENVHKNPWPYIGGAVGVGLLVGYIMGRNNSR
jgi:ElaB/YqjD/DUF883 family membrane-anchored ribosome-binding protein